MINSPSFLGYTRLGAETTAAKTDLREVTPPPSPSILRSIKTYGQSNLTLALPA